MSDAAVSPDDETSVPALWEAARRFLHRAVAVCGGPCALVAEGFLSRKERREIARWLRLAGELVRRLLVVEAARMAQFLPPATTRSPAKTGAAVGRAPRPPFCRFSFPYPDDSSGWAVGFSLLGPPARKPAADRFFPRIRDLDTQTDVLAPAALAFAAAQHRLAALGRAEAASGPVLPMRPKRRTAAGSPWPLAKRMEALMRVLKNPDPHARRLARRLRRDAARLACACRPPPPRPPGQWPDHGEDALWHAGQHALRSLAAYEAGPGP